MLDLTLLTRLKKQIITATDFKEPWEYFFTHFAEVPGFIALGNTVNDEYLTQVISQVASTVLKQPVTVSASMLKKIPEYDFIHGAVFVQNIMANIIYFSDVDTGIFAMLKPRSNAEFMLVRFSCATATGNATVLH